MFRNENADPSNSAKITASADSQATQNIQKGFATGAFDKAAWSRFNIQAPFPNAIPGSSQDQVNRAQQIENQNAYAGYEGNKQFIHDQYGWAQQLALMVNIAAVTAGVGSALAPAASAAVGGGTGGAIAGGAATGAVGGAIKGSLTGGNIGKDIAIGGLMGGIGGAASTLSPSLASSTGLSPSVANAVIKGGVGAIGSAVSGANPIVGGLAGAGGSLAGSAASDLGLPSGLAGIAGNAAAGAIGNAAQGWFTPPNQLPTVNNSINNTGNIAAGAVGSAGLGNMAFNSGNVGGGVQSLLGGVGGLLGYAGAAQQGQTAGNVLSNAQAGSNLSPWGYNGPSGQYANFGGFQPQNQSQYATPQGGTNFAGLAGIGAQGAPGGYPSAYGASPPYSTGGQVPGYAGGQVPQGMAQTQQFQPNGSPQGGYFNPNSTATNQQTPSGYGNQINVGLGQQLTNTQQGLNSVSGQATGNAGMAGQGLPYAVQQALQAQSARSGQLPQGTQGQLQNQSNLQQGVQGAQFGLIGAGQQQLNNPLTGMAQLGAANQIGTAGQAFNTTYQNTLANLQQQLALPTKQAESQLNDAEFQRGQLGTSGGALQTQAFATGLGQANLGIQNQAFNQALSAQNSSLTNASGLAGIANNNLSTGNNLLSNAFGQFNNTSALNAGTANNIFSQNAQISQLGNQYGQQNFQNQITGAGLPAQLQAQYLQNANQAVGGSNALTQQGNQNANLALQGSVAQGNQYNNAMGNAARIIAPSYGQSGGNSLGAIGAGLGSLANATNGIGSAIGGVSNAFGNIFGGGNQNAFAGTPYANNNSSYNAYNAANGPDYGTNYMANTQPIDYTGGLGMDNMPNMDLSSFGP